MGVDKVGFSSANSVDAGRMWHKSLAVLSTGVQGRSQNDRRRHKGERSLKGC